MTDGCVVPPGYIAHVLAPWGTPINDNALPWDKNGNNSSNDLLNSMGMHHDGMHFFPLEGSSTEGLLAVNHEYIDEKALHPNGPTLVQVLKTYHLPHTGKLSVARVWRGTVADGGVRVDAAPAEDGGRAGGPALPAGRQGRRLLRELLQVGDDVLALFGLLQADEGHLRALHHVLGGFEIGAQRLLIPGVAGRELLHRRGVLEALHRGRRRADDVLQGRPYLVLAGFDRVDVEMICARMERVATQHGMQGIHQFLCQIA